MGEDALFIMYSRMVGQVGGGGGGGEGGGREGKSRFT